MKSKFKIGEYVYHKDRKQYGIIKSKGTYTSEFETFQHDVEVGGKLYRLHWNDMYLEHCRIKDTKIARKMNKDNINKIESGWIYLKN